MFGKIFSSIGGFLGNSLGGGILSTIGRFAGRMLGTYLDQANHDIEEHHRFKNIKDSFSFSKAVYGHPIALLFGSARVVGKIIWSKRIEEVRTTSTENRYFKQFRQVKSRHYVHEYEYFLSFAVAICQGKISDIVRVWANDKLVNLSDYNHRIYYGDEMQEPDQLIAASSVNNQAPAFRDLAYIVFEDLPLADFGDTIPSFSFEVVRKPNVENNQTVEDLVKSIVMIPGSGEFVYDTIIQHKTIKNCFGSTILKEVINSHNYKNIANSIYSLNQLQTTCQNIEWVAVVSCWFGDNLDTKYCSIKPAVEFNDNYVEYSETWRAASYTRETARIISKDERGNPRYGGSVNDASIIRYLQELKKRKLKIMFYPMIFMDLPNKPWRGHLSGDAGSISEFFNKPDGYNNYILHYARLVRDHVDAFVIGSELIGITKIIDSNQEFTGVVELVKLAKLVKEIVGSKVLVTYAADWSEYHHTSGGWYNLDLLWSSTDIDFIGIDAYFPVTETTNSNIDFQDIINGWAKGEGYDYYIQNGTKHPLSAEYAWKNLKYWWENYHKNPNGILSSWQPRMKKIWFTEFGFPSIDKATNQPNIFFDPNCIDGGLPKYSSGEIDFSVQRRAIRAFIEYWSSQEYIGQMFLWTWDARPYPAWPHMDIWRDGSLWEKGHWVNNKFGAASLASIIVELSQYCKILSENIDVTMIDESVEGVIFNHTMSVMDAINILRIPYFFDITSTAQSKIKFVKRGANQVYEISNQILIKLSNNSYVERQEIAKNNMIAKLGIYFIDRTKEYSSSYCKINSEDLTNKNNAIFRLPITLSPLEAERLGKLILRNARFEDKIIKFIVPATNIYFEPTDFIILSYLDYQYQLRITDIKLGRLVLEITAIIDDISSYYLPVMNKIEFVPYQDLINDKLVILDLPFSLNNELNEPYFAVYLKSNVQQTLYASFSENILQEGKKVADLTPSSCIGEVVSIVQPELPSIFLFDEQSSFTISCYNFEKYVLQGWNLALCGNEIIKFCKWSKIEKDLYKISFMIRGHNATEKQIAKHIEGENFVLLTTYSSLLTVSGDNQTSNVSFRLGGTSIIQQVSFNNKSQKLPPPWLEYYELIGTALKITWRCRTRDEANPKNECEFFINIASIDQSYKFITREQQLSVDTGKLALSEVVNISIIAKSKQGIYSLPLELNL